MSLAGVCSYMVTFCIFSSVYGQRITTIQLDGVQYFISRMNPYSPELNFFLSYQYCRSLGLQLASFETKEKADSIAQYLTNTGYGKYDFWVSGNVLGTGMPLWMSTGLPFNATFNYMRKRPNEVAAASTGTFDIPTGSTSPQRTARESGNNGLINSCVAMKAPSFEWDTDDCTSIKDFICEQTRCYYYNYGPITVSSAQGKHSTTTSTTIQPYTSSPATQETQKYLPMTINKLLNKFWASTYSPSIQSDDVDSNTASPARNEDAEIEFATNGPYDNFHVNSELQDDPAAIADQYHHEEDYVSTVEPDTVTTFSHS